MAGSVVVDAGFLVALLNRRDRRHQWAVRQAPQFPRPWLTCEAALSEKNSTLLAQVALQP